MNENATIFIRPSEEDGYFDICIEGGQAVINGDVERTSTMYTRTGLSLKVLADEVSVIENDPAIQSRVCIRASSTNGRLIADIPNNWNIGH